MRICPMFHVLQIKPVIQSHLCPPIDLPPTPTCLIDNHHVFPVCGILDVHRRGRGFQYLVDWECYSPEEKSWNPQSYFISYPYSLNQTIKHILKQDINIYASISPANWWPEATKNRLDRPDGVK